MADNTLTVHYYAASGRLERVGRLGPLVDVPRMLERLGYVNDFPRSFRFVNRATGQSARLVIVWD